MSMNDSAALFTAVPETTGLLDVERSFRKESLTKDF
jgi:hypothetical protein